MVGEGGDGDVVDGGGLGGSQLQHVGGLVVDLCDAEVEHVDSPEVERALSV